MKGVKFYMEYASKKHKRGNNDTGQCIAVFWDSYTIQDDIIYDCIASLSEHSTAVCGTIVSWGYLREKCKRISEQKARLIHPELFNYLELK